MSKPPNIAASRRNSRQLDQTVSLYNYEADDSERVETWTPTAASPHSITARIDLRNSPRRVEAVRESGDVDVDARVYISDDGSGVSAIHDGGGKGASVIAASGYGVDYGSTYGQAEQFRVLVSFDEQGGLLRLDCSRMD